jgi:NodT family efflux transporter outer membrane factor (OMF) lipoprotein
MSCLLYKKRIADNMKQTLSALLLPLSLLSGCAMVGPDYQAPPQNAPAGWTLPGASKDLARAEPTGDISRWWQTFSDPMLSSLVEQALQSSPDLRSAQARLRESRARRNVAGAGLYPTANAFGTAARNKSSEETGSGDTRNSFSAGFDASWELDVFGGIRRDIEAAEADLEASQADLHDTQVSLAAEVALNYIELRSFQIRLQIARDNLATQAETLQLTEWRAQAGLASSQDVEQARTNYEQTRALIPSLDTGLAETENRLSILLGANPGSLHARLAIVGDLPAAPMSVAVGIPADALRQRPDVRTAERRLAAETARVGVAEAARYPSFNLAGSIGLEALTLSALGNSGAGAYSLLGGITAPIFDAGRLRSQVEIQDALREQALINYEQTVLNALEEVENALASLVYSRQREQAWTLATEAAHNAALLARNRYSAGLTDFQSVLDTERSVLVSEEGLANSRADGISALIRLYKALGGGWSPQAETRTAGKDAT